MTFLSQFVDSEPDHLFESVVGDWFLSQEVDVSTAYVEECHQPVEYAVWSNFCSASSWLEDLLFPGGSIRDVYVKAVNVRLRVDHTVVCGFVLLAEALLADEVQEFVLHALEQQLVAGGVGVPDNRGIFEVAPN